MSKLDKNFALKSASDIAKTKGGKFLSTEWGGVMSKYEWKCKIGHIWFATYSHVQNGTWCPGCDKTRPKEPEEGISNLRQKAIFKNYILIEPIKWEGVQKKYALICKKHEYLFYVTYNNFVNHNRGCCLCGREKIGQASKLTDTEVKKKLNEMGLTWGPKFAYQRANQKLEDVYFRGKIVKKQLDSMLRAFKQTGLPVGFTQGSVQDSWLGFVCSLASDKFEAYCYLPQMDGFELDGYDPQLNRAYEFNGKYYHANPDRDIRKKELCDKNNIELLILEEVSHPKTRQEQAKLILEYMYPNKINEVLNKLNDPNIDKIYQNWCDSQGLFDRKRALQTAVREDLINDGLPMDGTARMRKLMRVISPKAVAFSQEIRDLAIRMGFLTHGSKEKAIRHSRALGIKPIIDQFGNIYNTATEAANKIGVSSAMVSRVLKGRCKATRGIELRFA